MKDNSANIYKSARRSAGLTQERWAEFIGVSEESIRLYESGRGLPSDEIVTKMADVSGMSILGLWHLKEKSALANDLLPEVESVDFPQAVIKLLCEVRDFKESSEELLTIAADGYVSAAERDSFTEILDALDGIIKAALTVKFCECTPKEDRDYAKG